MVVQGESPIPKKRESILKPPKPPVDEENIHPNMDPKRLSTASFIQASEKVVQELEFEDMNFT